MGNSATNDHGNVYVRTDKPYYFSGEQVTGTVYINITKPGFPGNILSLKIKGQEKLHWSESRQESYQEDGQTKHRTEIDHYYGKNLFYSHQIPLYSFNGQYLQNGQFAFPFQFVLLPHIPGSFADKGGDWSASIIYKVKAEINSFKNDAKLKHHQELIVREPLKSQLAILAGEMSVQAKTWCCINQGYSKIKCVFDKNNYLPGDDAQLWIDIDNRTCELNVNEIRAVLNQTINLRSRCGRGKVINRTMARDTIQGVPARSSALDSNRKTMFLKLINQHNANDNVLKPSTEGSIVQCSYQLSATAHLSGCTCCTSDPAVNVPIRIVAPVPLIYQNVPQVQDWNPQTFEVIYHLQQKFKPVLVNFTEKDMYVKQDQQQNQNLYPQNPVMNQMNNQMTY